jgi:hypothetical protein
MPAFNKRDEKLGIEKRLCKFKYASKTFKQCRKTNNRNGLAVAYSEFEVRVTVFIAAKFGKE